MESNGVEAAAKNPAIILVAGSAPATFYKYENSAGRVVIADSLDHVPPAERATAVRIELDAPPASPISTPGVSVDWASFALGFGAALALSAVLLTFLRGSRVWLGLVVAVGLGVAATGLYLGQLRKSAGLGSSRFASPSAIIDDARGAIEKAKAQQSAQDKALEELKREAR